MTSVPHSAGAILKQSWQVYRQHFPVIAAVVLIVWIPLELLSSYMDAFVFAEDDVRKSIKFSQLLDNFFGIIATAGVIHIALQSLTDRTTTLGGALDVGIRSWARMWWTRFLWQLTLLLGFLLLIVPGVYLLVRLSLVEPVAVQERISGAAAIHRSYALTEGRFWLIFRIGLVLLALFLLPIGIVLLTVFVPALDHWLIEAAAQAICDVLTAFATIAFAVTYSIFNAAQSDVDAVNAREV